MISFNSNDAARQQENWAANLGHQAAELSTNRQEVSFPQLDAIPSGNSPSRLVAILDHFQRRNRIRQEVSDNIHGEDLAKG